MSQEASKGISQVYCEKCVNIFAVRYCSTVMKMLFEWENDSRLVEDMKQYVTQSMQRNEILDYVRRDFPNNNWSLRTLDRRHFEIYYHDKYVSEGDVRAAVRKEMEGTGKLLGYRALHLKIRQKYDL